MATFRILEDAEKKNRNIYPKRNAKVITTKTEPFAVKNENKSSSLNDSHVAQASKRIRLSKKENVVPQIKEVVEKTKVCKIKENTPLAPVVLDEDLLNLDANTTTVGPKEEVPSFPVSLLHEIEYREDIFDYLKQMEIVYQSSSSYMAKQPALNWNTRSILVDWLVSVGEEYKLNTQTLYLGVNYIDRFLSRISVVREKFQLVGAAAMMVAGKLEEIYAIESQEWSYLTQDSFSVKQLLKMEQMILKVLQFKMQPPTIYSFLEHLITRFNFDSQTKHLAMFLCEIMLLEGGEYLDHLPSKLASASIALARYTLSKSNIWPKEIRKVSGYSLKQLSPVVQKQNKSFKETPLKKQQAIQNKYTSHKYNYVATLKPKVLNLEDFDDDD